MHSTFAHAPGMRSILALILLASAIPAIARGVATPIPPDCSTPAKGISLMVPETTGYKPGQGWPNGSCNGGASVRKGIRACRHTLDKFIAKNSNFIHVAAQQNRGAAKVFGCFARTDAFEKRGIPKGMGEGVGKKLS